MFQEHLTNVSSKSILKHDPSHAVCGVRGVNSVVPSEPAMHAALHGRRFTCVKYVLYGL